MVDSAGSSVRRKMLVVAYDEHEGERLSRWLVDAGYTVVRYRDARRLAEMVDEERPDLLILDTDGASDEERTRVIGLCGKGSLKSPALVIAGALDREERGRGYGELHDCIPPPGAPDELLTRVRAMLRLACSTKEESVPAKRDALTRVYNRRYFDERLEMEIERARRYNRRVSCVMLDIDGFKEINAHHGHKVGDAVLRALADILLANTRSSDIVTRYGGEEFVIILPETGGEEAAILAERLRKAFEERSLCLADEGRAATVSCGIATYPDHAADTSTLMRMADSAVYRAKTDGCNRCVIAFSDGDAGLESDRGLAAKILLVEDNDYNRCVASLVLRASGYEVLEATDGEMGVSLARTMHPDLVIVDLQMDGRSGLETTKQIIGMDEMKNIPVVALTAGDVQDEIEELARAGCRGYITKPIDTNVLASQVQLYLDE